MGRFTFVSAIPILILPVAAYNLLVLTLGGGFWSVLAASRLTAPLFTLHTSAGGAWPVSTGDLLLCVAVFALFLDLVRASASRGWAIVNHALSMALFVVCLVEMLLLPALASSAFFLITLMVLLDVLAGFIVNFAGARDGG